MEKVPRPVVLGILADVRYTSDREHIVEVAYRRGFDEGRRVGRGEARVAVGGGLSTARNVDAADARTEKALRRYASDPELRALAREIAQEHGVHDARALIGRSRIRSVARARNALYLALRRRGLSYPEIGEIVGRDHTTAMAGERAAREAERAKNPGKKAP